MATNDFIGFASSGAANVMSQADYAAAAEQGNGVQPGMASSALANKVWRQGANMAAVIGELIKNHGINALDNGDLVTLYNALLASTASRTLAGLMSAADKTKLDGLISTDATPTAAGYMSAADKNKLDALIMHNILPPVGVVMWVSGNTVPDGCLAADGAAVSRTTYAELFAVIGTTWGEGDGSTTYNLPDARGRVAEGAQTAGGYNEPGLPNITGGSPYTLLRGGSTESSSGGLMTLTSGANAGIPDNGGSYIAGSYLMFDAAKSNAIYGNSSTVQPASVKLLPVIVYRSNAQ